MIDTFDEKKRPLFFPVGWANELVRWISGIRSPRGTLKVHNTLNPTEDGSLEIDVDLEVVTSKVYKILKERAAAKNSKEA